MWSTAREIAQGDLVIVWLTRDLVQPLVITPGKELNTKFGVYRHSDIIGVPYGSKIGSRNRKGFIHLLRPTPELWTLALPHRTQILYLADIAFITSWLDIKPRSRVIEAGTGSGSFSHSVARTIGPQGRLWSYEFHEARADKARYDSNSNFILVMPTWEDPLHRNHDTWATIAQEEFTRHGMDGVVTLTHRNVCKEGFTVVDVADSVFLDLPAPWDAVEHAKVALRKDCATRICCFSPCMEQVLRTVTALNDAGFSDITMYETLIRPHQVDILPSLPLISTVSDQLKQSEVRRETKRLRQIANSRSSKGGKRKPVADEEEDKVEGNDVRKKRVKTDEPTDNTEENPAVNLADPNTNMITTTPPPPPPPPSSSSALLSLSSTVPGTERLAIDPIPASSKQSGDTSQNDTTPSSSSSSKMSVSKAFPEVRGHTSYLTFAVLLPIFARESSSATEEAVLGEDKDKTHTATLNSVVII